MLRIAREADSGAGILAGIAEHHLHHVNGSAEKAGDFFDAAVCDRFLPHPRFEYCANRAPELLLGIFREGVARFPLVIILIFADELPPTLGGDLRIVGDIQLLFHRAQAGFEVFLRQADHDARVHLHETAVGVVGESLVLRGLCERFNGFFVEAEVEDRLHHAGHGFCGAGTDADEERISGVAQFFLCELLEMREVLRHLRTKFLGIFAAVLEIIVAGFGGNGETSGNG